MLNKNNSTLTQSGSLGLLNKWQRATIFPQVATTVTAVWYKNIQKGLLEMLVAVKLWQHGTQHKLVNPSFSCRFTEVCADTMTVSSQRVFKSSQGYAVACTT